MPQIQPRYHNPALDSPERAAPQQKHWLQSPVSEPRHGAGAAPASTPARVHFSARLAMRPALWSVEVPRPSMLQNTLGCCVFARCNESRGGDASAGLGGLRTSGAAARRAPCNGRRNRLSR